MKKNNKTNNRINNIVKKLFKDITKNGEASEIIEVEDLICEVRFTIDQEIKEEEIFGIINKYVKRTILLAQSQRNIVKRLSINNSGSNVYLSNENPNEPVLFEGEIRKKNVKSYWDRMKEE